MEPEQHSNGGLYYRHQRRNHYYNNHANGIKCVTPNPSPPLHIRKHWQVGRIVLFRHCTQEWICETPVEWTQCNDTDDETIAKNNQKDCQHHAMLGEVLELNGGYATVHLMGLHYIERASGNQGGSGGAVICVPVRDACCSAPSLDYRLSSPRDQFRLMLLSKLDHLVFRQVRYVNLRHKRPVTAQCYWIDPQSLEFRYKPLNTANVTCLMQQDPSLVVGKTLHLTYDQYDGRTTAFPQRPNDCYAGQEIYFGSYSEHGSQYRDLEFTEHGIYFNGARGKVDRAAPLCGQLIAGSVANNYRGLYYKKWFLCSPQLFNLVVLLRQGCVASGLSSQQALDQVDCARHISFKLASTGEYQEGGGLKERYEALHCYDYEWASLSGFDIYRHIVAYLMGGEPSDQVYRMIKWLTPDN